MKFIKRQKLAFLLIVALFILNISARIYLRGNIILFNTIDRAYEKLIAAYERGGSAGMEEEIERMYARSNFKLTQKFLDNVRAKINQVKDPKAFLGEQISEKKEKIKRFRRALFILNIFIITVLLLRLCVNILSPRQKRLA